MKKDKLLKMSLTAVLAALSYVAFTFLQIKVPLPGGDATSFHLGNAICLLAALLLGGAYGGLAGALGMTIGDLFDPVYIIYAPKTFILKFCIGLITGLIAHKLGKLSHNNKVSHQIKWSVIACVCGMLFNVIFDPLLGFLYKVVIIGKDAAEVTLVWNFTTTGVNAVISVIAAVLLYVPIRKALTKANMFIKIGKDNEQKDSSDK